jgi:hypothetical protein
MVFFCLVFFLGQANTAAMWIILGVAPVYNKSFEQLLFYTKNTTKNKVRKGFILLCVICILVLSNN